MADRSHVLAALLQAAPSLFVLQDEPMSKHTTFQIGGPTDLFLCPKDSAELQAVLQVLREQEYPLLLLGNGSNVLVSDAGLRCAVVCTEKMNQIMVEGDIITAEAGAMLTELARTAQRNALSGLEFAGGIPGTVGGAVYMNAGAYDGQMEQIVLKTEYYDENCKLCTIEGAEHAFNYRHSVFGDHPRWTIVRTTMQLKTGEKEQIKAKMDDFNARRREKQPLQFPSAGSTFKRPKGYFAGKLIEDAGMRGFAIGGAQVSEKHAGFLINRGGATFADMLQLIELVQQRVLRQFGIELECEVRILR